MTDIFTRAATEAEQTAVDAWPVLVDEIRTDGNGGLVRIRVTAAHPRSLPPDTGAKLADVIRYGWWAPREADDA